MHGNLAGGEGRSSLMHGVRIDPLSCMGAWMHGLNRASVPSGASYI